MGRPADGPEKTAESKDYCDQLAGVARQNGIELTELSIHLQDELVTVHPAYDEAFDGFTAPQIRLGMVGGGQGAFIGAVHRMAARLYEHYDLLPGALSSMPEKALASGRNLWLDPDRCYSSFAEMAEAQAALTHGIEALFILTHNYTGYPMVRHARELVQNGDLGEIRLVQMEYPQDWLAEPVEQTGAKQAVWRTDPAQSGISGSTGYIGTHAYNLCSFISGLELEELAVDVHTFVEGRRLDDNAHVMQDDNDFCTVRKASVKVNDVLVQHADTS